VKVLGFFLLLAGWAIVLAAVALLRSTLSQMVFVLAGLGVELIGLLAILRSHAVLEGHP